MTAKKWAGSYSLFETFTYTGQRVEFDAAPKDGEEITSAINKAKSVYSGCPTKFVEHGAKSSATRYDITRHEYGGGDDESGGGYIELLEINNAPNARWHIVIHSYAYQSVGGIERSFSEWDSVGDARKAFKFGHSFKKETLEKRKGFRRYVECSELTPWFYAIGEEPLMGDFAIHAGFEAHPVYRFGRKFLIQSEEGYSKVVTCMGSSKYSYVSEHFLGPKSTDFSWVIMFSDGSHIHIGPDDKIAEKELFSFEKRTISPIPDGEVWQTDMMAQFMKILSGHSLSGSIKLADGGTISLKYKPKGKKPPLAKGRYFLQVTLSDHSTMEGNVNFDPEVDGCESPVEKVMGKIPTDAKSPIVKVKIAEYVPDNNKKWRGVWYKKPKCIADS